MKKEEELLLEIEFERLIYESSLASLEIRENILKMKIELRKLRKMDSMFFIDELNMLSLSLENSDYMLDSLIEGTEEITEEKMEVMKEALEILEDNAKKSREMCSNVDDIVVIFEKQYNDEKK